MILTNSYYNCEKKEEDRATVCTDVCGKSVLKRHKDSTKQRDERLITTAYSWNRNVREHS